LGAQFLEAPSPDLVLFGAGGLGRRTIKGLRRLGKEPRAFVDSAAALWGTVVEGVPVLSPRDAATRYARNGVVCVTIWRAEGGHQFETTRGVLEDSGWQHVLSFLELYRIYPEEFLPYLAAGRVADVLASAVEVRRAFDLLGDDASREEFLAQLRWRLRGDFSAVAERTPGCDAANEYWPRDVVTPGPAEVVVDCGAYDGDTLARFAAAFGEFGAWVAFEPDPQNFASLQRRLGRLRADLAVRVRAVAAATGASAAAASFAAVGSAASSFTNTSDDLAIEVPVVALDEEDLPSPVTFVKLDVEGAERATLLGARQLLRRDQPLLAVSCYHRQEDLWELPLLVHELLPGARLALRAHAAEAFDLVLYAVPPGRSMAGSHA
jgi:FkbM family methyltransferase